MAEAPMRIYRAAEKRGDIATMDRAMGYVTEFKGRAENYKEEADRGMEEEKEERRENEKKLEKEENKSRQDDFKENGLTEKEPAGQKEGEQKERTLLMYTKDGEGVSVEIRTGISLLK